MDNFKELIGVQEKILDTFIGELMHEEGMDKVSLCERLSIIRDGAMVIVINPDDEREVIISFEIVRDLFPYLLVITDGERFSETKKCILELQKTNEVYLKG